MNWLLKMFTATMLKKLAWAALEHYVKKSENKVDDAVLSISKKVDDGNYDIGNELDMLQAEAGRLWKEHKDKEGE